MTALPSISPKALPQCNVGQPIPAANEAPRANGFLALLSGLLHESFGGDAVSSDLPAGKVIRQTSTTSAPVATIAEESSTETPSAPPAEASEPPRDHEKGATIHGEQPVPLLAGARSSVMKPLTRDDKTAARVSETPTSTPPVTGALFSRIANEATSAVTLPAAPSAEQAGEPTQTLVSRLPDRQGNEPLAKPPASIPEEHGREPVTPAPSPTDMNPASHAKAAGKKMGPEAQAGQSLPDQTGTSLILTGLAAASQPLAPPLTVQVGMPARVPELIPRPAAAVQGRDAGVQTGTKSPEDVATQRQIDPSAQSNASLSVDVPSAVRIGNTGPERQPATSVDASDIVATPIQPQALNSISPQAAASPANDSSRADGPVGDPPAPVDQLAPALISTLKTMGDGTQTVTVRLQPPDLGQVQIRVDQTSAGIARVDILAERPETMALLQRDQPRLDQALDQAGILSAGRSVSFQVGTQTQISDAPRTSGMAAGDSDRGQSGGSGQQSADRGGEPDAGSNPDQQQARARWFRAGLDILA